MTSLSMLLAQQAQERKSAVKTCKNCDKPIKWNVGLQRYDHFETMYDACSTTFSKSDGSRAEPKDG